eukprot:3060376-Prymnesium_polylepis.2
MRVVQLGVAHASKCTHLRDRVRLAGEQLVRRLGPIATDRHQVAHVHRVQEHVPPVRAWQPCVLASVAHDLGVETPSALDGTVLSGLSR